MAHALSALQKKVAHDSFIYHGSKKHECKKCGKVVNSDSVERWASHLRGCANVSSETKSMLPTAKGNCSVIVIDASQQPDPGPSCNDDQPSCSHTNSSLCTPEPKRRARAGLEVAEVTGKLTAWVDHMDSALQQRLDEAFASSFFQTAIPFHIADCSSFCSTFHVAVM